MGIFIGKHGRSNSFVGRFDPTNPSDIREYELVKAIVKSVNASSKRKFRVCKRGRKPVYGYEWGGNPKGGIKNAKLWDVYIYRKSLPYNVEMQLNIISNYPDPTWSEYSWLLWTTVALH